MDKKTLSESKRALITEIGEMILKASDQEIAMVYGLLMGISLAKA